MTMVRAEVSVGLCGLATSRSPPPVLRTGGAERVPCARAAQARGRGRPRRPCATSTGYPGAGAGVPAQGRAQGASPRRSGAFTDAVRRSVPRALPGLTPGTSREAFGSPAPRTTAGATWASRRPVGAFRWRTPLGLMSAPGRSTPGPCHGCAPRGGATSGPQAGRVSSARPLPRTPMGDRRGPAGAPRGRRVFPPLPWHL